MWNDLQIDGYYATRNQLVNGDDEVILRVYLHFMLHFDGMLPAHFADLDVFNTNPSELFDSHTPNFVVINNPTEACGRLDGCESGSWRVIAREKPIKSDEAGKVMGFKKILKFCRRTNLRDYKRSWIMELYRLKSERDQSQMICKIRILFQPEINILLSNHFSRLSSTESSVPAFADHLLPAYGFDEHAELRFLVLTHRRHLGSDTSPFSLSGKFWLSYSSPLEPTPPPRWYAPCNRSEGGAYLERIMFYNEGDTWPSHVTNDVYKLEPWKLVDPYDDKFRECGVCIYANRSSWTCGATDECEGGGCWRILQRDKVVSSWALNIVGFKRVYTFWEKKELIRSCVGDDEECWILEEYRLTQKERNKVVCVIKYTAKPYGF